MGQDAAAASGFSEHLAIMRELLAEYQKREDAETVAATQAALGEMKRSAERADTGARAQIRGRPLLHWLVHGPAVHKMLSPLVSARRHGLLLLLLSTD
jgi:hypothetical protein